MDQNPKQNNVIQFPGRKRNDEVPSQPQASTPPPAPRAHRPRSRKPKATLAGAVLAIIFATAAVNHYAFTSARIQTLDASSYSGQGRAIASVDTNSWHRDAQWEKQVTESLASPRARVLASAHIGRAATLEEKLRFGILDDLKYTIYKPDAERIESITLQGGGSEPTYIPDRALFLEEYGSLLSKAFASAELKSVETGEDKTIEEYTLFDKDKRPKGEVYFELDRHKRLLSLKVEPIQL
jgi:hypothetical protein